jgi:hypothetical protein
MVRTRVSNGCAGPGREPSHTRYVELSAIPFASPLRRTRTDAPAWIAAAETARRGRQSVPPATGRRASLQRQSPLAMPASGHVPLHRVPISRCAGDRKHAPMTGHTSPPVPLCPGRGGSVTLPTPAGARRGNRDQGTERNGLVCVPSARSERCRAARLGATEETHILPYEG